MVLPQDKLIETSAKLKVKAKVADDFLGDLEEALEETKAANFFKRAFKFLKVIGKVLDVILRYKSVTKMI